MGFVEPPHRNTLLMMKVMKMILRLLMGTCGDMYQNRCVGRTPGQRLLFMLTLAVVAVVTGLLLF